MLNTKDSTLGRRSFLRGAAGFVGATVMGLPGMAMGGEVTKGGATKAVPMSLGFWDGARFVAAESMGSGDATIASVRITMRGHGAGSALAAVSVSPWVARSSTWVPFKAWQAPPQGGHASRFSMAIHPQKGLRLTAHEAGARGASTDMTFTAGTGAGPKLQEGRYVLVAGKVNWDHYLMDVSASNGPVVPMFGAPALTQYVVIDLVRE